MRLDLNQKRATAEADIEAVILTGGKSVRMGRDKSRLILGGKTMLVRVLEGLEQVGLPVRIIANDLRPGCGPMGGIHTVLKTTQHKAALFMCCDMPFVTPGFYRLFLKQYSLTDAGLFVREGRSLGFPFIVRDTALEMVEEQLTKGDFSLQRLAQKIDAKRWKPPGTLQSCLFNINSQTEWRVAQQRWTKTDGD